MIIGRLMAFRGDTEICDGREVLVDVTEVEGGRVELAFDGPGNKVRTYIQVDLGELVAYALLEAQPDKK
jgi:hypothetical protein